MSSLKITSSTADEAVELTPVMQQYKAIKTEHSQHLLFYQMGDFYELFFEDAEIAAKELNIILTKKQVKGQNIPMCGVPCHSYENYLERLIKAGYKVAICEQLENPEEAKTRGGSKAVIKREVSRVVTPGTVTEEGLLPTNKFNYLASICVFGKIITVAWLDISTGDFYVERGSLKDLYNIIYRIKPKEIIINQSENNLFNYGFSATLTEVANEKFNFISNQKVLEHNFNRSVFSELKQEEVIACGVLLDYVNLTQREAKPYISVPKVWQNNNSVMRIDFFTRESLELTENNNDNGSSLKSSINSTITRSGARLLDSWISAPLINIAVINSRLDVVEYFTQHQDLLHQIRLTLKDVPDIIRVLTRLTLKRGGPRDLLALKEGLNAIMAIQNQLAGQELPSLLKQILDKPQDYSIFLEKLSKAIIDDNELPIIIKEGGFIKKGYDKVLDSLRESKIEATTNISKLQEKYIGITGINNLKIQYNGVIGYFIEVSGKQSEKLLQNNNFIHKQTLSNVARFSSEELILQEAIIIKAKERVIGLEQELFFELVEAAKAHKEMIFEIGNILAEIDVLTSFAKLAIDHDLNKPIVDDTTNLKIEGGRHLVVEISLKKRLESKFIPNDCIMDEASNLLIITGPNMAGKSTFLRQNALIIIMAQIGCFVPAKHAYIGVVDAIFSRVGSADNLYKGQSTFMVEMAELAVILNNATKRSFIVLDEVGRGTATYDGVSIACAALKYLHDVNCSRTIFATHYHELTALKEMLHKIKLYYMAINVFNNELIFMHKLLEGVADKSYGIYVAKLAGIPEVVIHNAKNTLEALENNSDSINIVKQQQSNKVNIKSSNSKNSTKSELPLFLNSTEPLNEKFNKYLPIYQQIKDLEIDSLSPKEALDFLYQLKNNLKN